MKLTLYIDYLKDVEPFDRLRESVIEVIVPNSDMYHAFEAWLHLSKIDNYHPSKCVDDSIDIVYDVVLEACIDSLGLTQEMYKKGVFDIDDPIPEDENNASAIVTIYVPQK